MSNKRYYWLKLMKSFFSQAKIKKLRKIAGGDTYIVIYLKMMLLSVTTDGELLYEGVEPTFAEELALIMDEDVQNVKVLLSYLYSNSLITEIEKDQFVLVEVLSLIGSEGASAERVRNHRKKQELLHGNSDVTVLKQLGNVEENRVDYKRKDLSIKDFKSFKENMILKKAGILEFRLPYPSNEFIFMENTIISLKDNGYLHNKLIKKDLTIEQAHKVWNYMFKYKELFIEGA